MDNRKSAIMQALRAFVAQRPGFDPRNYDRAGYRSDSRRVTQQRHDFERLALSVETLDEITADDLLEASTRAFSGRLSIKLHWDAGIGDQPDSLRKAKIDYCAGQYWCTEYRAAACAVLASALWDCQRKSMEASATNNGRYFMKGQTKTAGEWLRTSFRNWYGRGIQSRWFN